MIKLTAIDLDGTLYNSDHQITPRGREAIHAAQKAGLNPVIVTGRGRRGAEMALENLQLDLPFICSAGSLICAGKSLDEVRVLSARTFHVPNELNHLIEFSRKNNIGLIADSVHLLEGRGVDRQHDEGEPDLVVEQVARERH